MEQIKIPDGYHSDLNLHDTQVAIKTVKDFFQQTLSQKLNLLRVSAPVFVSPSSGLNDNLNGVERPVSFDIKGQDENAEIVHSLAKWKRYALKKYGFAHGEGPEILYRKSFCLLWRRQCSVRCRCRNHLHVWRYLPAGIPDDHKHTRKRRWNCM